MDGEQLFPGSGLPRVYGVDADQLCRDQRGRLGCRQRGDKTWWFAMVLAFTKHVERRVGTAKPVLVEIPQVVYRADLWVGVLPNVGDGFGLNAMVRAVAVERQHGPQKGDGFTSCGGFAGVPSSEVTSEFGRCYF